MTKHLEVAVVIDDENIEEIFDDVEVKFSKAKLKKLKELVDEGMEDLQVRLEETLSEFLSELIQEEWER